MMMMVMMTVVVAMALTSLQQGTDLGNPLHPVTVWCATALGSGGVPPGHRGAGSHRPLPCCRTSG
jgi:hypothetical protein